MKNKKETTVPKKRRYEKLNHHYDNLMFDSQASDLHHAHGTGMTYPEWERFAANYTPHRNVSKKVK